MVQTTTPIDTDLTMLINSASRSLRSAALDLRAKQFVMENDVLFKLFKRAASRYLGGETLEDTIAKVLDFNNSGLRCSIEFMGESTKTVVPSLPGKQKNQVSK